MHTEEPVWSNCVPVSLPMYVHVQVLILQNHGLAALGSTVEEAFDFLVKAVEACKVQVRHIGVVWTGGGGVSLVWTGGGVVSPVWTGGGGVSLVCVVQC